MQSTVRLSAAVASVFPALRHGFIGALALLVLFSGSARAQTTTLINTSLTVPVFARTIHFQVTSPAGAQFIAGSGIFNPAVQGIGLLSGPSYFKAFALTNGTIGADVFNTFTLPTPGTYSFTFTFANANGTSGDELAFSSTVTQLSPSVSYPAGAGPSGLAIDSSGNLWVANTSANTVTELSPTGASLGTFSGFSAPVGLGIERNGTIWVVNSGAAYVTQLSPSGSILGTFALGEGSTHLAIDPLGNLWISNPQSESVTELDPNGNQLGIYGLIGSPTPEFITFDGSNDAWIGLGPGGGGVQVLAPGGGDLKFVSPPYQQSAPSLAFDLAGNVWLAGTTYDPNSGSTVPTITELDPFGDLLAQYPWGGSNPVKIVADADGDLWVADSGNNTVTELCATVSNCAPGTIEATYPTGVGPVDLVLDAKGNVWTANNGDNTVTHVIVHP